MLSHRAASRAPDRSPCDTHFHHGLLAVSERRVGVLFALFLALLLSLLAVQAPQRAQDVALWAEGSMKNLVGSAADRLEDLRRGRRTLQDLRRENAELRQRLLELQAKNAASVGARLEAELLSAPFGYVPPAGELILTDVIYVDHRSLRRTAVLRLPSGSRDDDWARRPVATVNGLLGRIISSYGSYARVLLVTDRGSSVGAMIERTRRQGIIRGVDAGELSLLYLPLSADVEPGDRVITAGIDGLYPRGIPIGAVVSVESGGDQFHEVRVVPAVDLGSLSHAFVWRHDPVPEGYMDGGDGIGR